MLNERAESLAKMKATFFQAPYVKILASAGDMNKKPVKFNIRDDEHVWAVPIGNN
jgi:hypothetical protein